jgi:hypothetical protein
MEPRVVDDRYPQSHVGAAEAIDAKEAHIFPFSLSRFLIITSIAVAFAYLAVCFLAVECSSVRRAADLAEAS